MSLTKDDLTAVEQLFKSSIATEVPKAVKPLLDDLEASISGAFDHTQTQLYDLKDDMAILKEDVNDIKEDVTALKTDVGELKIDVSELKTDVTELKTDVSVLKTDVTELKTDVSVLKTDMTEVKRDIKNIKIVVRHLDVRGTLKA